MAAFVNKGYGYLAPVEQNIEAWIQLEYPEYAQEQGIHHTFPHSDIGVSAADLVPQYAAAADQVSVYSGIVYLDSGSTGIFLWKKKRYSALILLVPGFMNVLVCLASPMSNAIRYELPTVAVIPLLVGWTVYSVHTTSRQTGEE